MRIDDVIIGGRFRHDMGDIDTLAQSIADIGLLHPIVVTPNSRLIAGRRRLEAFKLLGLVDIPATVVDLQEIAQGEFAENEIRKDFTWSEKVAISEALEPMERDAAKERTEASRNRAGKLPAPKGRTLDKVAVAVGTSRHTLEKAREIYDSGDEELITKMDKTGKVDGIHKQLRNVHFMSDSIECYTPTDFLSLVVDVMGAIDLDPCSNSHETPNVPAARHYTIDDNGLAQAWHGRVFMNPPYGREIIEWVSKLCEEYGQERTVEAIALVPSRTDTQWFRLLRQFPRCFVHGRLTFIGQEASAPFPSMAVYLGGNEERFTATFSMLGDVYKWLGA